MNYIFESIIRGAKDGVHQSVWRFTTNFFLIIVIMIILLFWIQFLTGDQIRDEPRVVSSNQSSLFHQMANHRS